MPRLIEYPRSSFNRARELANAVNSLGGSGSVETCAEKIKMKPGGGFFNVVSAARKHGLVDMRKDTLTITPLFKNIDLSYTNDERLAYLRESFLTPPLYRKLYDRFIGRELPVDVFEKLLEREFAVDREVASRITNYFVDGARSCELLVDNRLVSVSLPKAIETEEENQLFDRVKPDVASVSNQVKQEQVTSAHVQTTNAEIISVSDEYTIRIHGPGMDTKLILRDEDDFIILSATISKLKKQVLKGAQNEG